MNSIQTLTAKLINNMSMNQQQKNTQKNEKKISHNQKEAFKMGKAKESEIIGDACCSRHLYCLHEPANIDKSLQNSSFSVNSELLRQLTPLQISAEPLIEYRAKPEVDMLAEINIRQKNYEKILQKCQQEIRKEEKQNKLAKINDEAKDALQKCKKISNPHKNKWGHSIYSAQKKKQLDQNNSNQKLKKQVQTKIEVKLKPIEERIKIYKTKQQEKKQQQRQKSKRRYRETVKDQEQIIKANANKILDQIKAQKIKKQEQKKTIQAKIRALQLKSRQKLAQAIKKPFEGGDNFSLGDSQYSTFSARANNRKLQKKKKKMKPQPPSKDDQLNNSKPGSNFLRKSSSSILNKPVKLKTQEIPHQQQQKMQQQNPKQEIKGPFFIWNIPIYQDELEKLEKKNEGDVFMNIERFNHKSNKTFRQEANQYLTKKMQQQIASQKQISKQQKFMKTVELKKEALLKTYELQTNQKIKEFNQTIWNEDQIFKPSILQNFHFYKKNTQSNEEGWRKGIF